VNGALCYPKCRSGFHNVACCVCSPNCPSGMTDGGIMCTKQIKYDPAKVPDSCDDGWEKNGLLCYPKCRDGYHNFGCCICRPPVPDCTAEGMNSGIDLSCAKKSILVMSSMRTANQMKNTMRASATSLAGTGIGGLVQCAG
jgi:hypothetical protein